MSDNTKDYYSDKRRYIERVTKLIRDVFEISIPIINMESVVEKLGGTLEKNNELLLIDAEGRLRKKDEGFIISVNEEQSESRMNFTIAHELGHLFLHMGYMIDEDKWNAIDKQYYRKGDNEEEFEANEFAAAFLMPRTDYKDIMDRYTEGNIVSTTKIAEYFNVSVSAALNRGKWLGYLK